MRKEKKNESLSFLDASHPMKYLLTLPINYENSNKSLHIADSNPLNRYEISGNHNSMFTYT